MTKSKEEALKQRVTERIERLIAKIMSWEDKSNILGNLGVARNYRDIRFTLRELLRKEFGVELDAKKLPRGVLPKRSRVYA
jgi:hypothetical protein